MVYCIFATFLKSQPLLHFLQNYLVCSRAMLLHNVVEGDVRVEGLSPHETLEVVEHKRHGEVRLQPGHVFLQRHIFLLGGIERGEETMSLVHL